MTDWEKEARKCYSELGEYAAQRTGELSPMLRPYIESTDQYGELICRATFILGTTPPRSEREAALWDLMADVFDFLYEARFLIIKGKLEIAYPLARRAYESLSLMAACHFEPTLADRWIASKKISNAEVRKVLDQHPMGEKEDMTRELYSFFSQAAHPNRGLVAKRFLGDGNEFVLGAIGVPNLTMLADYALRTLNLWFWFGAFISFVHREVLSDRDPRFGKDYLAVAKRAQEAGTWLTEQYNDLLGSGAEKLVSGEE